MKNILILSILSISFFTFGQESGSVVKLTVDEETDSYLKEIDEYAKSDINSFRNDLSEKFGATKEEMDRYLVQEKIPPSDVYYGYVLSSTTKQPVTSVMKMHSEKKGWGSVAQELGIKPGSEEFHALKENTFKINRDEIKNTKDYKHEEQMMNEESHKHHDNIEVEDKNNKKDKPTDNTQKDVNKDKMDKPDDLKNDTKEMKKEMKDDSAVDKKKSN